MNRITIDPVTRLEGHGKIEIFLDPEGEVANAYFQIPELRGFERFCVGRPVEEMATLTSRICGVCPEAHHMAAAKAADAVYGLMPPRPARLLRELLYSAFVVADHTTHFYVLSGPDFLVGPDAPPAERNILGVIHKVGLDIGGRDIAAVSSPDRRPRDRRCPVRRDIGRVRPATGGDPVPDARRSHHGDGLPRGPSTMERYRPEMPRPFSPIVSHAHAGVKALRHALRGAAP